MTKFTREDYEMAAKAAGIELEWFPARVWNGFIDGYEDATDGSGAFVVGSVEWNPPEDDGDALRLAVTLNLQINPTIKTDFGPASTAYDGCSGISTVQHGGDGSMATREAIFRAAIAIGKERNMTAPETETKRREALRNMGSIKA